MKRFGNKDSIVRNYRIKLLFIVKIGDKKQLVIPQEGLIKTEIVDLSLINFQQFLQMFQISIPLLTVKQSFKVCNIRHRFQVQLRPQVS